MATTKMLSLTREEFLKRVVTREVVFADGAKVHIRAIPAKVLFSSATDASKAFEPANLLVQSLCDENGKLLFTEAEKDNVMVVDHVSLKLLLDEILDLNGLKSPAEGKIGAAEKN